MPGFFPPSFLENLLPLNDLGLDLFLKMKRIEGKVETVSETGGFLICTLCAGIGSQRFVRASDPTELNPQTSECLIFHPQDCPNPSR